MKFFTLGKVSVPIHESTPTTHRMTGKWAAEVYDFLFLMHSTSQTVVGLLLLLLLGWSIYWLLIFHGGPLVLHPYFSTDSWQIMAPDLLFLGIGLILAIWGIHSGFYYYLWAPFRYWIVPGIILVFYWVCIILSTLLELAVLPFLYPVESHLIRRWRDTHPAQYDQLKNTVKPETLRKVILEHLKFQPLLFLDEWNTRMAKRTAYFFSSARIGIATINSFSYEENFQAAKVPLQLFTLAVNRMKVHLFETFGFSQYIELVDIPRVFKVKNNSDAEFIRKLFGLDILIWGSYTSDDSRIIYLNIQQDLPIEETGESSSNRSAKNNYDELQLQMDAQWRLFPYDLKIDVPALKLNQEDAVGAYITLMINVLLALQNRRQKRANRFIHHFDRLYWKYLSRDQIINYFIYESLAFLPNYSPEQHEKKEFVNTAATMLVTLISNWIGYRLSSSLGRTPLEHAEIKRLEVFAEKCAQLMPDSAETFYRLGALECLLNKPDKALRSFRRAGGIDEKNMPINAIALLTLMECALNFINLSSPDEMVIWFKLLDLKLTDWARFVTYGARAVNTGDQETIQKVEKFLNRIEEIETHFSKYDSEKPHAVRITLFSVLRRLMQTKH